MVNFTKLIKKAMKQFKVGRVAHLQGKTGIGL